MKVLIVDDEKKILRLLQFNLEYLGYKIKTFDNPTLALKGLQDFHPDVILLDVMMPELNGFQVVNLLRQKKQTVDTPIIMLTAKSQYGDVLKAYRDHPIDYYIAKPFTIEQVSKGIQMVCATKEYLGS